MDLYSTFNSLAPKISYLSLDYNDQPNSSNADIPPSEDPVYILGNKYSSLHELEEIRSDVRSRIWITYRRNFTSIGDTNFTSDSGWGCMLRCGQMVLANAFSNLYLGRDWRWTYSDYISLQKLLTNENAQEERNKYCLYRDILKLFMDAKTATYSIHQIALMGVCEGKEVGQWFGPNTIAQVLKKLSTFDKTNNIYIHVALDNVVYIEDIKKHCRIYSDNDQDKLDAKEDNETKSYQWKPLILFIPLRLGLSQINPLYFRGLKTTFIFPQSLGILGGRPNHALYFIGCCGDDLIYLDPHTTQSAVHNFAQNLDELEQLINKKEMLEFSDIDELPLLSDDITYHCERPYRMSISMLDPSLSLCFFYKTEEEFDHWANLVLLKLSHEEQPLFETMISKPQNWIVNEEEEFYSTKLSTNSQSTNMVENMTNSLSPDDIDDEEFEIIE